jgi:XRE family transcriptional regulator, regulator of sulfur utilization
MEIERRLAERVKAFRKAKGWSQEELADRAGIHRTFVSQVERATKRTTIRSLEKLVNALGVSFGELLD